MSRVLVHTPKFKIEPNGLPAMIGGGCAIDITAWDAASTGLPWELEVTITGDAGGMAMMIVVGYSASLWGNITRLGRISAYTGSASQSHLVHVERLLNPSQPRRGRKKRTGVWYTLRIYRPHLIANLAR